MILQILKLRRYSDSLVDPVIIMDVLKIGVEGCNGFT